MGRRNRNGARRVPAALAAGSASARAPDRGLRARSVRWALTVALCVSLSMLPAALRADSDLLAGALAMLEAQRSSVPSLSINDAASRAQDRFGGRVISVTRAEQDGRPGFRVKILLENGRVKTLFVDDRTGNVFDRRNHDR